MKKIFLILIASLGVVATGCKNQVLCTQEHSYTRKITVQFHWDEEQKATIPNNTMRGNFFSLTEGKTQLFWDFPSCHTNEIDLVLDCEYMPISYDYDAKLPISFRGEHDHNKLEAVCMAVVRTSYTKDNPSQLGKTYGEAPYPFYVANDNEARVHTCGSFIVPTGSDHLEYTVDLYPRNVSKMYTFRITGVEGNAIDGLKYVTKSQGGVSGMSASYFIGTGLLASDPSTIFFEASMDLANGWIVGKFATFGQLADNNFLIEAFYPTGQLESATFDVTDQVTNASGLNDIDNPDIILEVDWNIIPIDPKPNGGVDVIVNPWGDEVVVPLNAPARFKSTHQMVYCADCGREFLQEIHTPMDEHKH